MAIRSAVKTIVVKRDKVLLIKYITDSGFVYYELPGGGQNQYEEMEAAAKREFFEETGFHIKINRLAAIAEEIFTDEELRESYPNYTHRIHHIFHAVIISEESLGIIELDKHQVGYEWVSIEDISNIYLIPKQLKVHFYEILNADSPMYLGTGYEEIDLK